MKFRNKAIILLLTMTLTAVMVFEACNSSGGSSPNTDGANAGFDDMSEGSNRPSLNFGAAFGWRGYADTDLKFSEFFSSDHTIVARFMPQYPVAGAGPVLAENGGGNFFVGQHLYFVNRDENGVITEDGSRLVVSIGSKQETYVTNLIAGEWHHLALVRSGNTFKLYLNGLHLSPDLEVAPTDSKLPAGDANLRIGRRTSGKDFIDREVQFYGLVDDVAVFGQALSAEEIQSLNVDHLRLSETLIGGSWNLTAGWTFDTNRPSGGPLPPQLERSVSFHSPADQGVVYEGVGSFVPAQKVPISQFRQSDIDATFMLPPFHRTTIPLPFKAGQAWEVQWGPSTLNSHYGIAAFTWDFILASNSVSTGMESENPSTCAQGLYAPSKAKVIDADDDNYDPESKDAKNVLRIRIGQDEKLSFMHILTNSASSEGLAIGSIVQAGQRIASVGTRKSNNCHLHFGLRSDDNDEGVIPMAFSDYYASDDNGLTWYSVTRGVPQTGQWIMASGENTTPSIEIAQPVDGTSVPLGGLNLITFEASVSDPEDGSQCCSVTWSSDLDGFLGGGPQTSATLSSVGIHTITATVTDSDGASSSDFITMTATNDAPVVTIQQPLEGAILYRDISYVFNATVSDVNEPLSPLCNGATWVSSQPNDPVLTGCNPSAVFTTNGARTLTLTAQDSHDSSANDHVTITVTDPPPTGPPIVTILSPDDGDALEPSNAYTLVGTATDPDGESPLLFEWTVTDYYGNVNVIGSSPTIRSWRPSTVIPSICGGGTVQLKLTVTDPDGEIGIDTIDIGILYPPC